MIVLTVNSASILPKFTAFEFIISLDSMEKLVCLLKTDLKNVICGLPTISLSFTAIAAVQ